jgi:hypothetical protein
MEPKMGSRIVYEPQRHICEGLSGVNLGEYRGVHSEWWYPDINQMYRLRDGTVRECGECGKTWVAGSTQSLMVNVWREEGRFERWWRERKQRKAS